VSVSTRRSVVRRGESADGRHGGLPLCCRAAPIVASLFNPSARLKAFLALVRERGETEKFADTINKLIAEITELGERRNRLIHDPWIEGGPDAQTRFRLEITANRRLHYQWKPETIDAINDMSLEIYDAKAKFMELYKRALDELPPFPRKQFEQSFEIPEGHLRQPWVI
jgi:hypothetical protein